MKALGVGVATAALVLGVCGCSLGGGDDARDESSCPAPEKPFVRQAWVTDDSIEAIAVDCTTIYVAGAFESIGPRTGPLASLPGAPGRLDVTMPVLRGEARRVDATTPAARVTSVVSDGAGGWWVAGEFGFADDQPCPGVARVLRTGKLDSSACLDTDGLVRTMARLGDTVYLGGDFTRVSGRIRGGLAAVDVRTGEILPWAPRLDERTVCDDRDCSTGVVVNAIAVAESAVYAGGFFNGADGVVRTNVAALDPLTGTLLAFDAGLRAEEDYFGSVEALAVAGDALYLSCPYCNETFSDEPLHRLSADSGRSAGPPIAVDEPVRTLTVHESTVYAGGSFRRIAGSRRAGAAALEASTGRLLPWQAAGVRPGGSVTAIARDRDAVYLGTEAVEQGRDPNNEVQAFELRSVDARTGRPRELSTRANGQITALRADGRSVVVGGDFSGADVARRDGLAAVDGARGSLLNWAPETGRQRWEHPRSLLVAEGRLYVGGSITHIDGELRRGLASFDLTTRRLTPWSPIVDDIGDPFFDGVVTLASSEETIYVGGDFTRIGESPRLGAAAIDSESGEVLDWNPQVGSQPGPRIELGAVSALAVDDGRVYVGGEFEQVAGSPRAGLARVDDSSAELEAWDPNPNERVDTIMPSELGVYLGGWFEAIDSHQRNALALLDAGSGSTTDFDADVAGEFTEISAIVETEGMLVVVGDFDIIGGKLRGGLAGVDPSSGRLLDWNLPPADRACWPTAIATGGGALVVDGHLSGCGNYESGNVEQLVVQPFAATG